MTKQQHSGVTYKNGSGVNLDVTAHGCVSLSATLATTKPLFILRVEGIDGFDSLSFST